MIGRQRKEAKHMIGTENETRRGRIPARPRINTRESGDWESWDKRALIRFSDIVRLVGPEPTADCERYSLGVCSGSRRPCEACEARNDWEGLILDIVRDATADASADPANGECGQGWGLFGSGHGVEGCPGRRFTDAPSVYRHARHPGVVVVSWGGGLDI